MKNRTAVNSLGCITNRQPYAQDTQVDSKSSKPSKVQYYSHFGEANLTEIHQANQSYLYTES